MGQGTFVPPPTSNPSAAHCNSSLEAAKEKHIQTDNCQLNQASLSATDKRVREFPVGSREHTADIPR